MPMDIDENRSVTELIEEFRTGDREAAAHEIWRRYEGRILGMAERGIARDLQHRVRPGDILSTVIRVLLKGVGEGRYTVNSQGTLGALVYRITSNKIRKKARKERNDIQKCGGNALPVNDALPDRETEQADVIALAECLQEIHDRLKPMTFEVLSRLEDGQTISEIADEMDCSEATVITRLEAARPILQRWDRGELV